MTIMPAKKATAILKAAKKRGVIDTVKVYGLQKDQTTKKWSEVALITEGMNRLEHGNTFELSKELDVLIEENKDWIYFMKCRKVVQYSSFIICLCTILVAVGMVIIL